MAGVAGPRGTGIADARSQPTGRGPPSARRTARSLLAAAGDVTFLPPSGYCYQCDGAVTQQTTDATGMTGRPICGVSWCDRFMLRTFETSRATNAIRA